MLRPWARAAAAFPFRRPPPSLTTAPVAAISAAAAAIATRPPVRHTSAGAGQATGSTAAAAAAEDAKDGGGFARSNSAEREFKDRLISSALAHVPQHGWSSMALHLGQPATASLAKAMLLPS